jgi:hypothetical protein
MNCYLCGAKIGFFRRFVDQQYCSQAHRFQSRLVSARALREADDEGELWTVTQKNKKAAAKQSNQTASVIAMGLVALLVVAVLVLPSGPVAIQAPSPEPDVKGGLFRRASNALGDMVRTSGPITLKSDLKSGMSDWASYGLASSRSSGSDDWTGGVRGGTLRLWNRTTTLNNYQVEFLGQIEKKSLGWAYRATDGKNFYATKLVITKPGPLPNAGLVRYVMMNGRETDRVQLPLPLTLDRGVNYRVRVSVEDDRFVTWVNGQVVSSWRDTRLKRGGVGFFGEEGDSSNIAWVSLSERDSFLGRVLAHFSLITVPTVPLP